MQFTYKKSCFSAVVLVSSLSLFVLKTNILMPIQEDLFNKHFVSDGNCNREEPNTTEENKKPPWWDDSNLHQCSQHYKPTNLTGPHPFADEVLFRTHSCMPNGTIWNETPVIVTDVNHCGYRSALRGNYQYVISYSMYGDNFAYYRGFPEILFHAKILFPEWVVRLYIDPRGKQDFLCPLLLRYKEIFDICDVRHLPRSLGDVAAAGVNPMVWRMIPFGDPMVIRFNSRDTDSRLTAREQAAVLEWIETRKFIHVMRDNPEHTTTMLGGMFGIYQPQELIEIFDRIRTEMFKRKGMNDQWSLAYSFRNDFAASNTLQHDSYSCGQYKGSWRPFPTQRPEDLDFVGRPLYRSEITTDKVAMKTCPEKCRPKDHQNWTYC